jgi:hypothetical protein
MPVSPKWLKSPAVNLHFESNHRRILRFNDVLTPEHRHPKPDTCLRSRLKRSVSGETFKEFGLWQSRLSLTPVKSTGSTTGPEDQVFNNRINPHHFFGSQP